MFDRVKSELDVCTGGLSLGVGPGIITQLARRRQILRCREPKFFLLRPYHTGNMPPQPHSEQEYFKQLTIHRKPPPSSPTH